MQKYLLSILPVLLFACEKRTADRTDSSGNSTDYNVIQVKESNTTPTVDISGYTLLIDPKTDRRADAAKILHVKRQWPLVMQSPTVAGFDTILARNFTFSDGGNLLNRADYIRDRTQPSEWKITHVVYDNLTLQFLNNDMALLTYRNRVTNQNLRSHAVETEYISWADVYTFEDDKWKIASAHVVDFRMEPAIDRKQ